MGNIKIWGQNIWKVIASGNSTGVATTNAGLLKDGETAISVYDALERLTDWMITSKGYIAWLAKNGGGGSGSGGSTVTEATCTIKVRGTETDGVASGGQVIMGASGIDISLSAIDVNLQKAWTIVIRVGSVQVAVGTASYTNSTYHVSADKINGYLQNHSGTLSINASYEDENKGIYGASTWMGAIVENTVILLGANADSSVADLFKKQITYQFSVGYRGDMTKPNYLLSLRLLKGGIEQKTYTEQLTITQTTLQSKSINLVGTLFTTVSNDSIGAYTIEANLTALDNSAITAKTVSSLTIASENILIATTTMQEYPATIDVSVASSLNLVFTAYVQSLQTFQYDVQIGDTIVRTGAAGYFGQQVSDLISVAGKPWAVVGQTVQLLLTIHSGDKTAKAIYGIKFVAASDTLLTESTNGVVHLISEMTAREHQGESRFSFTNPSYVNGASNFNLTSQINLINKNSLSKVVGGTNAPYLRLSNGSAAIMQNWVYGGRTYGFADLFPTDPTAVRQFTISICFKADYHADDNRTILYTKGTGEAAEGGIDSISVDVHDIYLGTESVYKLTDNTINMVDIVCLQTVTDKPDGLGGTESVKTYVLKIYLDGVPTVVRTYYSFPNLGEVIYLGCRHEMDGTNDVYYNMCDMNIYNLQIYDTALTDYDIMIKYINNKVLTSYTGQGEPDFSLILPELRKNFCERSSDGSVISHLYNADSGKYTIDFLVQDTSNGISLNEQNLNDYAKAIGIPIMLIDVSSNSAWTFQAFAAQQAYTPSGADTLSAEGIRCQYWDPNGSNSAVITMLNTAVQLQGHSTLADFVKNINITVPNDTVFIPKDTWYPEQTYTLKADIVDSSHSNNAAIGTFINEVLGPDNNGDGAYLPFDQTAIDNVYKSTYKANQQPSVSLKHTVTGFPVLVIMKFYTAVAGDVSVTSLGIYSFNLGRDAFRNLGFRKVNKITVNGTTPPITTFPYLATGASVDEKDDTDANWIEIANTSEMDISNIVDTLPAGFDTSKGDFWQNNSNILNNRYEVRFGTKVNPADYDNFKAFVGNIMAFPIEGTSSTSNNDIVTIPQIVGDYNLYSCDTTGNNYAQTGLSQTMTTDTHHWSSPGFNPESFYKYFIVGNLFGLIDNFGKNSTYRSWLGRDYFIDFYDMDSANGGSNQGMLTIGPDTWLKYLYNKPEVGKSYGYINETFDSNFSQNTSSETKISANSSKLWLSLDTPTAREVCGLNSSRSAYTSYWYDLRATLQAKAEAAGYAYNSNQPATQIVDWFMNDFFIKQTGQCGPLLFSYDYKLKYLLQFTDDSYKNTKALTKLHGRKIAYTRDWLTKHITFLDSLFSWRDSAQARTFRNNRDTAGSNSVLNTREDFPLTTNCPIVLFNAVGDNTKSYYFMQQNKETWVNAGKNASNSVFTWNMSNSPNIIKIGNTNVKLNEMNIQNLSYSENKMPIDYNGYPAITELDLSKNSAFAGFNLDAFRTGAISEIRELDFSNTSGAKFALDLTYNDGAGTWFTKLTKINISNSSCISLVSIPRIPLKELNVVNSAITSFTLKDQAYLDNVDLTGCNLVTSVTIDNCDSYKNLILDSLDKLSTVSIKFNKSLETISITNCNNLSSLNIEQCPNLQSIVVSECGGLTTDIVISDCIVLQSIDFSKCSNLTTMRISQANQANITSLDLSSTKVSYISGDNVSTTLLDLSGWKSLASFNIAGNSTVTNIQLPNETTPINLIRPFSNCINLERVYGHFSLGTSALFNGCSKFSIHGSNITSVRFNGQSVLDGSGRVKLPYEVLGQTLDTLNIPIVAGLGVTNLDINTTSLNSAFAGTNCTTFDVYYIFSKATDVTSASSTFSGLKQNPFYWTASVDNSPNRNMFHWATKITTLNSCFYSVASTSDKPKYIRIFTPDYMGETVTVDNGLFSPLIDTLSGVTLMFYGYTLITDRFVFRHSTKNYLINSLDFWSTFQMISNSNTRGYVNINSITSLIGAVNSKDDLGNLTDFFQNLPAISGTMGEFMTGTPFINFSTISNIPSGVTEIVLSFNPSYAVGTLTMANMFTTPANLTRIDASFRIANTASGFGTSLIVEMPITDDFFKEFTNLKTIGYNSSGSYSGILNYTYSSFCGAGIHKYIDQNVFPYNILQYSASKIETFAGFFMGCWGESLTDTPQLPSTMFQSSVNLLDCEALFMDVKFGYTLTGESFENCSKLQKVSYLFASSYSTTSTGEGVQNYLSGSIPNKLFYHGIKNHYSETVYGIPGVAGNSVTSITLSDTNGTYIKSTLVIGGVTYYMYNRQGAISWTDASGNSLTQDNVLSHETISYDVPRNNITDMAYVFQGANISYYINNTPTAEANTNYMPYSWTYSNGKFTSKRVDTFKTTEIWNYDGVNSLDDPTVENLDVDSPTSMVYHDLGSNVDRVGTLQFCCSPDLLRYCSLSCSIVGMFNNCGHNTAMKSYGASFTHQNYGLHGRIPPYLLYPLMDATSVNLDYFFHNCKVLSPYKTTSVYMIPAEFFKYCPNISTLIFTFAGMVFPAGIELNIFSFINSGKLGDVSYCFYTANYTGTSDNKSLVANVFSTMKNLGKMYRAFAATDAKATATAYNVNQYVKFNNIFPPNIYNKGAYVNDTNFSQVFAYYGTVTEHEDPKSLADNTTTNNYTRFN